MDHPLIQHKIGIMRDKNISTKEFRALVSEVAMLIYYEASRNLPLADKEIETPLGKILQEIEQIRVYQCSCIYWRSNVIRWST